MNSRVLVVGLIAAAPEAHLEAVQPTGQEQGL